MKAPPCDGAFLPGISTAFAVLSPSPGHVVDVLLTLSPLYYRSCPRVLVRLACIRHAASVRSEPGSNSSINHFHEVHEEMKPAPKNTYRKSVSWFGAGDKTCDPAFIQSRGLAPLSPSAVDDIINDQRFHRVKPFCERSAALARGGGRPSAVRATKKPRRSGQRGCPSRGEL